jgi:hypothetical protein
MKGPKRASKRRKVESTLPTNLSRTELLELDQDQLVGKILMRIIQWQLETPRTRNVMHLSQKQRSIPLWSNPAVHTLLGKGPQCIPKLDLYLQWKCKKLAPHLATGWC